MIVAVTGWAGYLGPVIVRRLRERGHAVLGIDTGWYLHDHVAPAVWPDFARWDDIREAEPILRAYQPDVIVHLAGLSNDPLSEMNPGLTTAINEAATRRLLRLPGRHVVVSSCSVYGTAEDATEDTEPAPLTPYARAKAEVDAHLPADGVALRLGTVWGPSPGHRLDLVVNRMVYDASWHDLVTATGNAARPLVHIEDVADAVAWAVEGDHAGIYNIVGENIRMYELAQIVGAKTDAGVALQEVTGDLRDYRARGDKAAAAGWVARRSLANSLEELIAFTDLMQPRESIRLATLKRLIATGVLDHNLRRKELVLA